MSTRLRRYALVTLACLAAALPAPAQSTASRAPEGLPPLIDRELFFGNPEIIGAQLSPNGAYVAFIKPWNGTRNIWVKKATEPFDAARLVTAETRRPIPGYFWSRDSKYILFVQDNAGDENFNVYAVDPSAPAPGGQPAPAARNLTAAKGARALLYAVPKATPDIIYVGLNDRDAAWHDVYRVRLSTGARTLVRRNTERIADWTFDLQGNLRLATRVADNGDTEILAIEGESFRKIYGCTVVETCTVLRFHKDGTRFYAETNRGDRDLTALVLIDAKTGAEQTVESDPEGRVDLSGTVFSDATDELVATVYLDDRPRYRFRDRAFEADYQLLTSKLAGQDVSFGSSTADEQVWLVTASSDTEPGATYLFDRAARSLTLQYRIREKLPREHLASMRSIRYLSSDGLEIPAYLTLPEGLEPKSLPLVVVPHGGPWARDAWDYDGLAQFLANRGYAVLQPNFRGSTGYGKKFLNAGNREWGEKMQDDITWGVRHLIAEGIADPKRVGIMGGSYGGYATLAGVAFTPDVYAVAVSIVGPSNLLTLLDSLPPYWEAGRKMFYTRMGDPTTEEGKKQLMRQSPLNAADKIRTPLLVVQGANDPRVKKAESDQIVAALRDRGFDVAYLVAPDEGHGFQRPVNSMAMFAAAEKFLAGHLRGRYQPDMPPDVATRLKEITVDPKTVTLPKKIGSASVGAPAPAVPLQARAAEYDGRIEGGGQTSPFTTSLAIRDEGGAWVVTESAKLAMGEATDTTTLDKATLQVRKRSIRQGPVEVDLTFADGKATGSMTVGGQQKPIDAAVGGPIFADGAGTYQVIATLPLAEGYTAAFRNFDVRGQKATIKQATVTKIEELTVPAGTFKAYRVEITSAEGDAGRTTVWVAAETREVLKISSTLPQMGGATMVAELKK